MQAEEQTCRICRGEATPDDPLFYPCKCRGSIKFIHQGCLEEWLKHSGREPSCDICHEKYKFTTQFKEDTPDRVPISLILLKLKNSSIHLFRYGLTITSLVLGVGIQIPLFWKATSRFFTWIIDGAMPHDSILVSLIYGETLVKGDPFEMTNIWKALTASYFDSILFIIVWILIHLVLFLEHEWVSRDSGFKTLILKKIGPAENLVRPVPLANRMGNNANPVEFNERMLRDVQNLERLLEQRNHPQNVVIQDALRIIQERQRALQRENQNQLRQRNNFDELLDEEDEDQDPDFVPTDNSSDNESEAPDSNIHDEGDDFQLRLENEREEMRRRVENQIEDNPNEQRPMLPFPRGNGDELPAPINHDADEDREDLFDRLAREVENDAAARNNRANIALNNIPELNFANVNGNRAGAVPGAGGADINVDPAAVAAAAAAANAAPEQQDDLLLSLPIYMIIAGGDAFLGVYLFLAYFLPSGLGNLAYITTGLIIKGVSHVLKNLLVYTKLNTYVDKVGVAISSAKNYSPTVCQVLDNYLIFPIVNTITNVYEHNLPQSKLERIIPLAIFYGAVFGGILGFLEHKTKKHSRHNPLLGFQRKLFIILLDFVSTLKVFLIFAIELVFFPIYCGFLLELVCSPVFTYDSILVLSEVFIVKDYISLRLATYWAAGTIYMCLFALYVGMTRRYILRPGVLFFIRSPEDPNARLIHDALVRPLGLQLSRISLSGFVYSVFILIGFGTVTYAFKLTGSTLLPLDLQSIFGVLLGNVTVFRFRENLDLVKKYVRQYWVRAFKISCSKLRLSSFILGKHDPRERGYVVYRNLKCQVEKSKPDYTEPKSYYQAKELFKTSDVKAVFVPDGDLIRAPKNDTVSRKFVRKLFIPVSKDDKPLTSNDELEKINEKYPLDEFDESEDELTTTNHYEIVYRPPFFGYRIILFLTMIWIFAVLLICGVGLIANSIGKPFSYILAFTQILSIMNRQAGSSPSWSNAPAFSLTPLDSTSILIGLQILITGLKYYDDLLQKRHIQIEEENDATAAAGDAGDLNADQAATLDAQINQLNESLARRDHNQHDESNSTVIRDLLGFFATNLKLIFITFFFFFHVFAWLYLGISSHINAIEAPYRYITGQENFFARGYDTFTFNRYTIPLHLGLMFYTIVPFQERFRSDIMSVFRGGDAQRVSVKFIFDNYSKPILTRLASVELIIFLLKLGLVAYEYKENSIHYTSLKAVFIYVFVQQAIFKEILVFSWSVVIGLNIAIRASINGAKYFSKLNQQIKEEFYTTGKTLENSDVIEDTPTDE